MQQLVARREAFSATELSPSLCRWGDATRCCQNAAGTPTSLRELPSPERPHAGQLAVPCPIAHLVSPHGPGVCSGGPGHDSMPSLCFRAPFAHRLQPPETRGDPVGLHEETAHEARRGGSPGRGPEPPCQPPCCEDAAGPAQTLGTAGQRCRRAALLCLGLPPRRCPGTVPASPHRAPAPPATPDPQLCSGSAAAPSESRPAPALTRGPRPSCGRRSSSRAGRAGGLAAALAGRPPRSPPSAGWPLEDSSGGLSPRAAWCREATRSGTHPCGRRPSAGRRCRRGRRRSRRSWIRSGRAGTSGCSWREGAG